MSDAKRSGWNHSQNTGSCSQSFTSDPGNQNRKGRRKAMIGRVGARVFREVTFHGPDILELVLLVCLALLVASPD